MRYGQGVLCCVYEELKAKKRRPVECAVATLVLYAVCISGAAYHLAHTGGPSRALLDWVDKSMV